MSILFMFNLSKTKIIMLNFENQISCFHVLQQPLSCWICPHCILEKCQVAKLTRLKSVYLYLAAFFEFESECKIFFSATLCGKIKIGIKGQILFAIQIFKSCPKQSINIQLCYVVHFDKQTIRKLVILFVYCFILFLLLFQHFCSYCAWINE